MALPGRILIIDDTAGFVLVMRFRLEANGYEVLEADNGHDGINLATSENPDLILLDVVMPEMSGLEGLEQLKKAGKLVPRPGSKGM